jgi:hypothetical protein
MRSVTSTLWVVDTPINNNSPLWKMLLPYPFRQQFFCLELIPGT